VKQIEFAEGRRVNLAQSEVALLLLIMLFIILYDGLALTWC